MDLLFYLLLINLIVFFVLGLIPYEAIRFKTLDEDEGRVKQETYESNYYFFSTDYEKSLKRAIFLKDALQIDAYPFEISNLSQIKFVVENLEPSFKGFDLSLCENIDNIPFEV